MFTKFITLSTKDAYDKPRVVALPINNIAFMEEHGMGTIITLVNGGKVLVNELIKEIITKIKENNDIVSE